TGASVCSVYICHHLQHFLIYWRTSACLRVGNSNPYQAIPKFTGNKRNLSAEDFRSITLNVIASKNFEHCAQPFLANLSSSSQQFGFKKGLSFLNAISEIRKMFN